jgi:hypothetical protein
MNTHRIFTKLFWLDAVERIVATIAQFLLVLGGADGAGLLAINIKQILLLSLAGGIASLLKAIVAGAKANTDTASLTVDTKPL